MSEEFIIDQLRSIPGNKKVSGKSTFILCPFHSEKSPSARVFHDNGYLVCYGCGARKSYSVWSTEYGLMKMGKGNLPINGEVPKNRFLTNLLNAPADETDKAANLDDFKFLELNCDLAKRIGLQTRWRGFPTKWLMSAVGAKLAFNTLTGRHYVWLPVVVRSRLRGYVLAQLKKPADKSVPSYINAPGKWSLRYGLFPLDASIDLMVEKGLTTIVVVEGPRDALRLLKLGIPAVSMLGTHSWTDIKSRMLELSGVETVVLMLDGDKAGREATRFLRTGKRGSSTEPVINPLKESFRVRTVKLWNIEVGPDEEKPDPGNLPEETILEILQPLLT